ncbi:MAG: hypothetical protein AABX77_02395 [Nanoarchaeota archaeon]
MQETNKIFRLDKILLCASIRSPVGCYAGVISFITYLETQKEEYLYGTFLMPASLLIFGAIRGNDIYQRLKSRNK